MQLNFKHFLIISALLLSCDSSTDNPIENIGNKLTINFEYGVDLSPTAYKNIYAIWIENEESSYIQNISICQKVISGKLTGTALPYWKMNKYPISSTSEIDAVSSATKANTDFSVSASLKVNSNRKFTLYFEIDRSYDPNSWFTDQPALVYSANIDLDEPAMEYELIPIGWTPNESTENIIKNTPKGRLQTEMRYITNNKDGSSFGALDERSATKMVKSISVKIEK